MGKRGGAIVEFGYTMSNNQIFASVATRAKRITPQPNFLTGTPRLGVTIVTTTLRI
jgi:hypothetical protein